MSEEISGIGIIAFACNEHWVVRLKSEKDKIYSIYVPIEVVKHTKVVNNGDFVQVTAQKWKFDSELSFHGFTHKAMSAKWQKKPQIYDCVGKIISIDVNGEFAYIESPNCGGKKETVYATRNTFQPLSNNLNNEIKKNDMVTVKAIEQLPSGNRGTVRFRTTVFTFGKYGIDADGKVYDKMAKRKIPGLTIASSSVLEPLQKPMPSKNPPTVGFESIRGSMLNTEVNAFPTNQKTAGSSVLTSMFIPTHPSSTDEYEIEYEKIRQLSYAIAGNRCNHCLIRRFDPNLKP